MRLKEGFRRAGGIIGEEILQALLRTLETLTDIALKASPLHPLLPRHQPGPQPLDTLHIPAHLRCLGGLVLEGPWQGGLGSTGYDFMGKASVPRPGNR